MAAGEGRAQQLWVWAAAQPHGQALMQGGFEPEQQKGFAGQTWICLTGAWGGLFPAQTRGCGVGNGLSGLAGLGSKDEHRAGLAKTSRNSNPILSWQVCPGAVVPVTPGQGRAVLAWGGAVALTSTASAEPVKPEGPWEVG